MYIEFACKVLSIDKILGCSFGLNRTETGILKMLVAGKKELSAGDIMKRFGKDRSTIQRSMKILSAAGLVHRRQVNLDHGGYVFVYTPAAKERIKEMIYRNFESFKGSVSSEIERW